MVSPEAAQSDANIYLARGTERGGRTLLIEQTGHQLEPQAKKSEVYPDFSLSAERKHPLTKSNSKKGEKSDLRVKGLRQVPTQA